MSSSSSMFPELLLEQEDGSDFSGIEGDSSHESKKDGNAAGQEAAKEDPPKKVIASQETRQVRRVRILLVGVIILGIAVSLGTYFFVNSEAENDYKISFDLFANAIEDSLENSAENLQSALRNLGESISDSRQVNQHEEHDHGDFPFVLVDMFQTHGEHALDRSLMEAILFAPLVPAAIRSDWEDFSFDHQEWIQESRAKFLDHLDPDEEPPVYIDGNVSPYVYRRRDGIFPEETVEDMSAPIWYLSPPPFNPAIVNFDMLSHELYRETLLYSIASKQPVFSRILDVEQFSSMQVADADHYKFHEKFTLLEPGSIGYDHPHSIYVRPVFASTKSDQVVGILMGAVAWDAYFSHLLPEGVVGVLVVLRIQCSQSPDESYSYELNGPVPTFLGQGDLHRGFNSLVRTIPLFMANDDGIEGDACSYFVDVYPSSAFKEQYDSNSALVAACSLGGTFLIVALVFFGYDYVVGKRNQKVTAAAEKSNAIVSSLFPENVRERLYLEEDKNQRGKAARRKSSDSIDESALLEVNSRPIAELFDESTIFFADIKGFTSWSSQREPAQVFELLECLYSAFDQHAKRRGVYKIETIGDCYVAVCGVPNPNNAHATVMTRFARDCVRTFTLLVQELESTLGPDTSDLQLRVGMHSGPVTGGVLRGDRARFQLFGDSMNTASRMESHGVGGKIHCSRATADLLIEAGKGAWLTKREDKIVAKGKGEMTTFWVSINSKAESSLDSGSHHSDKTDESAYLAFDDRTERWIDYNVATLEPYLKRIMVSRRSGSGDSGTALVLSPDTLPVDELKATIEFPKATNADDDDVNFELGDVVSAQLKAFVGSIASMYREIPFHSFEHATTVVMAAAKLLNSDKDDSDPLDPLTQFAVILSALIHDVDHQGVTNSQLAKEDSSMKTVYKGRSMAEQNSIELSWKMLMQNDFRDLRQCICATEDELKHLRQVMVNAVLSTDLFDSDLKSFRNTQWENAFDEDKSSKLWPKERSNLKATVLIGDLMQVSDISHTMQHFHIYRKWNTRLFCEMAKAYRSGRARQDPVTFWYESELQFFDEYVLPLAQRLMAHNRFGATAAEYFDNALENRREWESNGHTIIEEMKVLSQTKKSTESLVP